MAATTIGSISGIMGLLIVIAEIGLLIWVIAAARGTGRNLAITGMALLILARVFSFALPMAASNFGVGLILANSLISGGLNAAGLICLVVAFMRADGLAKLQQHGAQWSPQPQNNYRPGPWSDPRQS